MNYQPVRSKNQANKHAGPQEVNQNAGTEDNIDAGDSEIEAESVQDYFHPDFQQVDKEDQVFLDELERLKRQEQDANDASEAIRKEFSHETKDLLLQAGAAKARNDLEIPPLKEIYDNPTDGISGNSSYDDEGAVADFTNLESIVNVIPIPTSRINSIHPSTLILGDPQSAVQTRSKVTKSSEAHAFMDVKSAFLYGKIDEEVYVSQPPGFIDPKYPKKRSWRDEFEALMKSKISDEFYGKHKPSFLDYKSNRQKRCLGQSKNSPSNMLDNLELLGYKKSLGRALALAPEALWLPKKFHSHLWLAKVSIDSAKLIPLGKDSTAIEMYDLQKSERNSQSRTNTDTRKEKVYKSRENAIKDKILVPKPPRNCATCENPVDGLYCRPCAFVRKCLNEGWYTIHDENEILNTSESSNHNTNVVSAPREPFVFNQDPGVNSSQGPPQINNNCCYECGDSLDDIFCQRCTCKSCGKGAHYGYNCPPQIPIISNPEPCYNQNLNEILQNLQSLQQQSFLGTCQQCGCNEYDGVCFYCTVGNGTPINFSTPYSSNDSPNFANHSCEFCGGNSHPGYDCQTGNTPVFDQGPCYNQDFGFNQPLHYSPSFPQQCLCCEDCGGPHTTFQCQPMNQDFYNSNLFSFDQFQPPQFPVNYPPQETRKEILQAQEDLMEAIQAFLKKYDHIPPNEKCMALLLAEERFLKINEEFSEYINFPRWNRPLFYFDDDDDEYTVIWRRPKTNTPDEPSEEPEDPLIIGEEELNTIPEKDKSSVEDLIPIPIRSKGFSNDICDDESLLSRDIPITSPKIDFLSEEFVGELAPIPPGMDEDEFNEEEDDCYDNDTSNDDDSFENIDYVEASPPDSELANLEEVGDVILRDKLSNVYLLISKIEALNDNPILSSFSYSDNSFSDHTEETRRLTSVVISDNLNDTLLELPEFQSFHFDFHDDPSFPCPPPEPPNVEISLIIEPDAPVINNFDELNEDECFDPRGDEIDVEDDDSFTFVIRIFLLFLTYPFSFTFLHQK
ncbi:hypothetical protein Tco_1492463 [Tanacetum coccineum]